MRAYIAAQKWNCLEVFVERGVSGRREDRPQLQRMISQLDGIDVVVIPRLDRLGRNTRHLLELYDQFDSAGIKLVSLKESIDTDTPVGRLSRLMLSAVSQFESEAIGERVSAVMRARVEAGRHVGSDVYGYKLKDGQLIVVQHQAEVVLRVFIANMQQARLKIRSSAI